MPSQFSPADRETVKETVKDTAKAGDVGYTGNGLVYVLPDRPVHSFGQLQFDGWTITALYENQESGETLVQIEPITEVPDA